VKPDSQRPSGQAFLLPGRQVRGSAAIAGPPLVAGSLRLSPVFIVVTFFSVFFRLTRVSTLLCLGTLPPRASGPRLLPERDRCRRDLAPISPR